MVVLTEISEVTSAHNYKYDVFISFRGIDTRNNFTDHLYNTLKNANIRTFLDNPAINTGDELGPELVSAIESSRASIIVLSRNYASSTWCLDELVLILDQRGTTKHIVIPIFYHVVPSDVRKIQNSFGDAMAKHKQNMEAETNLEKKSQRAHKIMKWEKALADIADLKGLDVDNSTPETKLINEIVKEINSRLELHKRSKIPKIIGSESAIRQITLFLKDGSSHAAQVLTIWGMAGIGKTHLADYIFKLHYHDFERSCFLKDIERCPPNGMLKLQKHLLRDLHYRLWMDINDTDMGTCQIEESLPRERTLIVLDGINKFEQLDVLLGTSNLHPESRIIITSKSDSLTEKCALFQTKLRPLMHKKLLLESLNLNESLELFSWHAFRLEEPNDEDKKESKKVAIYCRGHPLTLEVLGRSLYNGDRTLEDIIDSLGKELNPDIQKVLKICVDSLTYEKDKELFKHIACFFVYEDRNFTEDIMKACDICKSSGVKILINKCLLKVISCNMLYMHKLFQDMGRDLVRQESPKKPWKRSLLWQHEECLDVLKNKKVHTVRNSVGPNKTGDSCKSPNPQRQTI
ncbi:disease resistance protein RUN1-like [Rutidosis leptorrhynchoides]|uniref:disease resistance protein RUN1-like n=1 Tax=Rutidosis leptorrhynchoides TaxID=125765 RepID=UPI003A994A60